MSKLQTKMQGMRNKIEANKPQLMVYGGVAAMTTATVMAVQATNKLPVRLDKIEKETFDIKNGLLTGKEQENALVKCKMKGYSRIALDYAPAVGLTLTGAASILGGFGIINERYVGVTAALATTTEAFNKYRANVVEEFGEETDYRLRHSVKKVETVNEEGETSIDYTMEESQYSKMFTKQSTKEWKEDPNYNYAFIKGVENYVNTVLQARGHVFLNEVYDQLGLDRTDAGQVVGWIYKNGGDGYIDFGIEKFKEFIDGNSTDVLLDFNVDGVIFNTFQN